MRSFVLSFVALASFCSFAACGGGDDGGGSGGGGNSGGSGNSGGTSPTGPCVPKAAECYAAGVTGPGAACMAKQDNTGKATWQGRITSIDVQAPAALATQLVQTVVIDKGISLNQPNCNENGDGTFNWLYEIDPTAKTIKTGGALPITDPTQGACFVKMTVGSINIAPITAPVTIDADGKTFHGKDIDVNVPIFLTPTNTANPIILPLHKVTLDATYEDDGHNCVGHYNGPELDPVNNCLPDTKTTPPQRAWTTAAQLAGYITIEEADQVFIDTLASSLCVLIAGQDWKGPDGYCKSSTKWQQGKPDGDWCSTTNAAADATCKDAWQLRGNFSGAGFKVTGDCP